jgi:tetratricopeptide (TPR) repeat protein
MCRRRTILRGLIIFCLLSLGAGCGTAPRPGPVAVSDRWVCPESADLPLRHGLYEQAINGHLRVIDEEPENALAHYHLGYAYGQLGEHVREVQEYERALDLGLTREDLFFNLGMAYAELGAFDKAEQALRRAVTIAPESADNHRALGMVYYEQSHFHEAIASCERATRLEPEDPHAWHCFALALAGAGRLEDSRAAAERVRRLDAHYPLDPLLLDLLQAPGGENQAP